MKSNLGTPLSLLLGPTADRSVSHKRIVSAIPESWDSILWTAPLAWLSCHLGRFELLPAAHAQLEGDSEIMRQHSCEECAAGGECEECAAGGEGHGWAVAGEDRGAIHPARGAVP